MEDAELRPFVEWATKSLGLRRAGFENFRGTLKKRIVKRMRELGVASLDEYRARLSATPTEWRALEAAFRIPVSRFYRDAAVFELLGQEILPERARAGGLVRVWSAGCASGEEPYTVAIVFAVDVAPTVPGARLAIVATDADEHMIARAREGRYERGSLAELPPRYLPAAFDADHTIKGEIRSCVSFRCEDMRTTMPDGPFDVVLCRNVALTYFDEAEARRVIERMVDRLLFGGVLVIGKGETLPEGTLGLRARGPSAYARV